LLVDGHHSRTRLPFLEYIIDPAHPWRVCIGVPYGTHVWQPHDSTELNGTFKARMYKEKLLYLSEKPPGMDTTWSTTDIIPLLNRTWEATLGNQYKAKKSIMERGWNPLNYVLLDHPLFKDDIGNPTAVVDLHDVLLDLETINTTSAKGAPRVERAFNQIAKQRALDEGAKEKFNDLRLEGMDAAARAKRYALITLVTSGKMCSMNTFCISDEVLVDRMHDVQDDKTKKMSEREERMVVTKPKQSAKFNEAARKYFSNKHLLVDDLKALLREIIKKNDSPVKKKADELRLQFNRRKHRMVKYDLMQRFDADVNVVVATNTNNDTPAAAVAHNNNPSSLFDELLIAANELDEVEIVQPLVATPTTIPNSNSNISATETEPSISTFPSSINNNNSTTTSTSNIGIVADDDIKDDDTVELIHIINGTTTAGNNIDTTSLLMVDIECTHVQL
jgi:hypothetical protein